ncbi:hypothetical protein [Lentibacillus salicampi]|uniref:Uncharacterized protein n=1 Tax=Lentibacillus salicampi TaxID=175306 RepID=A0A4Y9A848_9BACI|nr:hypothetical protein [Lentibacillus salicampi]TFJ91933.1 hypothetical protein E4U82_14925 [Lentibacillus salicampi]
MKVLKGRQKPIIEVRNFSFSYEEIDEQRLFNGLDFKLNQNEVTLLMGARSLGQKYFKKSRFISLQPIFM